MSGDQHLRIGVVAGVSVGIALGVVIAPEYGAVAIVSPIFAMLPDIDSSQSKLGRVAKLVLKLAVMLLVLAVAATTLYFIYTRNRTALIVEVVSLAVLVVLKTVFTVVENKTHIVHTSTRHRGIMHTEVIPILICQGILYYDNVLIDALLVGALVGYTSHLFADMFTKMGCPILIYYLIFRKNLTLYVKLKDLDKRTLEIQGGYIAICLVTLVMEKGSLILEQVVNLRQII